MKIPLFLLRWGPLLAGLILLPAAGARSIHVRGNAPETTEDGSEAHPYRSITRAIRAAGPGDTVRVHPIPEGYRESVDFYGHAGGRPGEPLTLDGQGAELIGSDPVDPAGWEKQGNLLVRRDVEPRRFIVVKGKMVFETYARDLLEPGEFAYVGKLHKRLYYRPLVGKEPPAEVKARLGSGETVTIAPQQWKPAEKKGLLRVQGVEPVASLEEGGQARELVAAHTRLQPGGWAAHDGVFYYCPVAGEALESLAMEACVRQNGVQIAGTTAHVIIRNFNARYFHNDGYNIHGAATHLEFYQCNARDMGDEGFSSHGRTETLLDGAEYVNCDNGIYNVNSGGKSVNRNVVIRTPRSVGFGASPRDNGTTHLLENAVLIDCPRGILAGEGTTVRNVVILTRAPSQSAINLDGKGTLERVAVSGEGTPLRALPGENGTLSFKEVSFGSGRPLHVRTGKPLEEVLRWDSCAFAEDLTLETGKAPPWKTRPVGEGIGTLGQGNRTFVPLSEEAFLRQVLEGALPGPDREVMERALAVGAGDQSSGIPRTAPGTVGASSGNRPR